MKLIFVNRYYFPDQSATSRMVTSLAQSLAERGWCVHVVASQNLHNDSSGRLAQRETVNGVQIHRVNTTAFGRGRIVGRAVDYATFHLVTMWHLLRHVGRRDVCVVCTDPPLLSLTALLPVALRGGILVNWLLDLFPEVAIEFGLGRRRSALTLMMLWLRDLSLRRSAANVAPMQRMTDYLKDRNVPEDLLVTIPHWSDGDVVRPVEPDANRLRREWGIGDRFVVGYSGNFGRAHEFATFLGAAEQLRHRKDIVFVFAGGGYHAEAIRKEIAARNLDNILMKPLQPEERLAEALGVADLHLISLLPPMEPFVVPSKLYGIMAAGRPAIFVGDVSGEIAIVLNAADCGCSVQPGDVAGLIKAILELAADTMLRARMGRNARIAFDKYYCEPRGVASWARALTHITTADAVPFSEPASDVRPR
jgi:glycosyltransferase involved in cell wall biosynthesis